MPTTRSQKSDSPCTQRIETEQRTVGQSESEGSASATSSAATSSATNSTSSGTTGSSGTVTTRSTEATSMEDTGRTGAGSQKKTDKNNEGSSLTLVPGSTRRPKSVISTGSRKQGLELELEMANLEMERIRVAEKIARLKLKLVQQEHDDEEALAEDEDRTAQVQDWLQSSVQGEENMDVEEQRGQRPQEDSKQGKPSTLKKSSSEIEDLTRAITKMVNCQSSAASQPRYIHELPTFEGNSSEWVAFRVVYEDTASYFSPVQNMARLRKAITGCARESIKSLLYSEAHPDEVMATLQRRYGRPDVLVLAELEKVQALPRISGRARDICLFAGQVNNSVAAIRGLKKPEYLHAPAMVKQIVDKMPDFLRFRWYDYSEREEVKELSDLVMVSRFLNIEADRCGSSSTMEEKPMKKVPYRQVSHATMEKEDDEEPNRTRTERSCFHCQGEHYLSECQRFTKMPAQERWALVTKLRLCFKCLQSKHRKENCRRPPCKICKRWHHHLLHTENSNRSANTTTKAKEHVDTEREVATSVASPVHAIGSARAYLKMTPVEVYGSKGSKKIMALMDEGSTVTLLDAEVAEEIGATGENEELVLETVGGKIIKKANSKKVNVLVKGVSQSRKKRISGVRTIDDLKLAPQSLDKRRIENCSHLKEMVNVLHYESEAPRLLIGQDNWELIVSRKIIRGKPGQPVASLTELGWVLHGYDTTSAKPVHFLNRCHHIRTTDEEMHQTIKDHFAIESLGVQPRRPTTDAEGQALIILEKTCKRLEDGRFEVGLLWKNENEDVPETRPMAERRLASIEKKIKKDPGLKEEYERQMKHLLQQKYAEEVTAHDDSARKWYLPHFSVIHPVKKKIRIVFDAAAKARGRSLNDALLPGPDLLQSLFGVLVRFRQGRVAIAADIREMFLQVMVRAEDRDSLRFLWREKPEDQSPKEYRMTRLIFGATSSPSSAIFVKNRNAAEYQTQYPEAAKAIERNHYMDDYLHSFHAEDQLVKVTREIDWIHKKAGFELRGWASNRPEVLQQITEEKITNKEVELGEKEEKTLGLRWLTEQDSFGFRSELRNTPKEVIDEQRIPTKREVTSAVMSTFDPLGLASPVLILGKRLLQETWRSGVGWDEEIEEKEYRLWKSYVRNLKILKNLHIPRCIAPCRHEGEIHVFMDASESVFAAAAYWRTKDSDGAYHVNLIAGKARVAPLKPVSIPRLELQAALLGSRLAASLIEELDLKVERKTYWTDSSVVLSWIKTDPRTFKTFVAHRLAEIEDLTKPQEWRWVSTVNNPADDATRDVPANFTKEHRWFTGPDFLRKEEHLWPEPRSFKREATAEDKEIKVVAATVSVQDYPTPEPHRFSSWMRLWRATARVLQFIQLCRRRGIVNATTRRKKESDPAWKKYKKKETARQHDLQKRTDRARHFIPIGAELLEKAEELLLKRSQEESFGSDIKNILRNRNLEGNSKLKRLDVEINENLIRLKGRINAIKGIAREYTRPIVLDSKNKITQLIIEDFHRKFNHGNHGAVMNEIRQKYLILGLRSTIRFIQHRCQWCRVNRGKPQEIPTGDLPAERLNHGKPAFDCAAVDYFGPMMVTVGRRQEKRWGMLFTCLTTRAVHIELAPSLSTDSMIMGLRRLAARRGSPTTVWSDNGTNFVGANKELKEALKTLPQQELAEASDKLGIQWKFIPPGAPNMGGAWERLVRSIKTALRVTLQERAPREEVLHTLLLEAEHIVNSRPLTNLTDNREEEALTPNHFLIGRSCGAARIGVFTDNELVGRHTWKATQQLSDHFWQRWVKEYLPELVPRKLAGRTDPTTFKPGDIVLIVDSSLPRCTWPRGRVQETYPGPDGRTRIVRVETKGGTLRRPSSRLVLLVPGTSPSPEDCAAHEGETVGDRK